MAFRPSLKHFALTLLIGATFAFRPTLAQQIQIPSLQVCNLSQLEANAFVKISSRGKFDLMGKLECDPKNGGRTSGALEIVNLNMTDSTIQGQIKFTTFDQVTSGGKYTPTIWVNGKCEAKGVNGCQYWLMVADNVKNGPSHQNGYDIVSFLVLDANGTRVAYGTGLVIDGNVDVTANGN